MSDKPPSETNTKVSNKEDEDTNKGPTQSFTSLMENICQAILNRASSFSIYFNGLFSFCVPLKHLVYINSNIRRLNIKGNVSLSLMQYLSVHLCLAPDKDFFLNEVNEWAHKVSNKAEDEDTKPEADKKPPVSKAALKEQFESFAKFGDKAADGKTIKLSQSDKWFKQAKVIDPKGVTTTDTGIAFRKISK